MTVCPEDDDANTDDEETTGSSGSEETRERTTIQFYGNITAYGNLALEDIELRPTRSASVATTAIDFKITVTKSNAGASLTLDNVSTWTDENWENGDTETTGFISQITGTSNATSVKLIDCDLRLKTGISSIGNLTLQDTTLTTCGTSSIYDLILEGDSSWDALGKTSMVNVDSSAMTDGYLGTKQVAKTFLSQLTITGTVSNPLLFRVATAACTTNDVKYLDETEGETYKNVMLAIALKADADNFIAYPYGSWTITDGESALALIDSDELMADNWIAYKDSNGYVYNGDIDDMVVSITKGNSVSYATSFYEAVTIINNAADTEADYTIRFLQTQPDDEEDYVYVGTAKNGAYGSLTLPTKASSVTICGATASSGEAAGETESEASSEPCTVLCYTGTMTPRCKVTFENILLTEGTYNSKMGVFTPSYSVTPVFGSYNYEITFTATAATLTNDTETNESIKNADLVFSYVSASKGSLTVENRDVYVKNYVSAPTLSLDDASTMSAVSYVVVTNLRLEDAKLSADSYITVTNLTLEGSSALTTYKAMKLTTLTGEGDDAVVCLNTGFTTITKSTQRSTTQLTISGNISDVSVEIVPYMYDLSTKTYHAMTSDEAATLNISEGKTLTSYDKIAVLTKAAAADITVMMDDGDGELTQAAYESEDGEATAYTLYKYEGGLYMTNQQMQVRLIGYTDSEMTEAFYQADFLSWDQAVKEIDRIADTTVYYDMLLMTDVGGLTTASTPLGTVSMPTKAAAVRIAPYAEETEETTDGDDDEHSTEETTSSRYLFFIGTTFTIRCDTTFDNVGLIAVKKTTASGVTSYSSTTFNITGNNWDLVFQAMPSGAVKEDGTEYECLIGTLNGGSKGSFTFYEGISEATLAAVATKLTNYGTVEFYNEKCNTVEPEISGGLSGVTNLILHENVELSVPSGALTATNLTMTESSLNAKNITSTGTVTLQSAKISAGTSTVGDGVVKLGTIVCLDYNNEIYAKQSSSGASQLTITGYVSYEGEETDIETDAAIVVGLYYNNSASKFAQLYDGMTLLTASKASASWFAPCYTVYTSTTETDEDGEETTTTTETAGMGAEVEGYELVKSGSAIKYTNSSDMEVRLYYLESTDEGTTVLSSTLFATFEEAVTEINNLSHYRTGTKVYEDYEIELLKDVEIGNTSGNGAYSSVTLPTKAGNVKIYSEGSETYTIYYSGTLTLRCNTEFEHMGLSPMKAVNKVGVATAAAWSLGAYTLTLDQVCTSDADGNTLVSSVSSSTGSELALRGSTQLAVSGNLSVYQIRFAEGTNEATAVSESEEVVYDEPTLCVEGTLTATLIYLDGNVSPVIQKPSSSSFTLNGASLDVDGDGVKESVSVIKESEDLSLTVYIQSDEVAAGTKVLTDKYLDINNYIVVDDSDFTYPTYQSGTYLMVGNLVADKTLDDFVRKSDGTEVTYKLSSSKHDYTGEEIKPGLILQCEEETLVEGTDYTLTYSDNILPGSATITITAAEDGAYEGSAKVTFTIRKKSLASKNMEITFDGSLTKTTVDGTETWVPGVKVVDKDRTDESGYLVLQENSDYTLTYRIESDGSVSAVISEYTDGYYRGKVVKNFTKVSATTTYTLTNCIAADTGSDTSAGAVDRYSDAKLLIQLAVSGSALDGLENLYILEMDNQGDDVVGYVGNAEAVYSSDSNTTTLTATLVWDGDSDDPFNSTMMDRFALVAVTDNGYQVISKNSLLVQNPEVTAVTTKKYTSYYTYSSDGEGGRVRDIDSKKGMQGASAYAGDLGVQAEVINIKLNELIKTSTNVKKYGSSTYVAYEYKGKTYYFHNMISYQQTLFALNGWDGGETYGITGRTNVTVCLLLGWDSELTYLIHPSARTSGHTYYALNMQDETARETFEALFCYLGYKLGGSKYAGKSAYKCRVLNWTLGNEVNCCKAWNYSGNLSTSACVANYAEAFQLLYQAIRRTDAYARCFISLDHSWTASTEGHSGKSYLDTFAAYMYNNAPQMSWNVNYHPYSQPLTRVDFWNDSSNTTSSTSTPYISMQNLSVLTNYLGTLETKYKMTSLCVDTRESTEKGYIRVILGEQGYTARYGYSSEESLQVTALQKLHSIATANTRVDAYTNRSYVDDASEAAGGLYLGLMNTSGKKKSSYAAFKKL